MAFARYYFETNKKMESAVRAGYKEKNAHIIANRLIKDSLISNLIEEWREAAIKRSGVTKERALIELGRLATFDPRKMYQADGTLKNPKDWDDDVAAAVASLDVFEEFIGQGTRKELAGQTKKVKFWNKPESLKTLLQHLGLLVDKKEISGEFGMNHKGSVVLLPAKMSADEWADQFDNPPED
jgi:phage terminase small subunit